MEFLPCARSSQKETACISTNNQDLGLVRVGPLFIGPREFGFGGRDVNIGRRCHSGLDFGLRGRHDVQMTVMLMKDEMS